MSRRVSLAMIALAVGLVPPLAQAQEPGVFVDPGSPAGKEYALPLVAARRFLFGGTIRGTEGLPGAASQGTGANAARSGSSASGAGASRSAIELKAASPAQIKAAAVVPDHSAFASSALLLALAVVVAGGAAGLLTRRLQRR